MRVLITGAAGRIGSQLRKGVAGRFTFLRLHDLSVPADRVPRDNEEWLTGDLADPQVARAAVEGIDVLVHLAGVPRESDWASLLKHNIEMPVVLFEAARAAGVRRIVYASSHHAVGMHDRTQTLTPEAEFRPDSRYGVTKVFGEALCRLFHDKYGLSIICVRIGAYRPEPETHRHLVAWQSPRDSTELLARCIETPGIGYSVYYGVSANTRGKWTDDSADELGFVPVDDAEAFAASVLAKPDPEGPVAAKFHGGAYSADGFSGQV
jgi:uronate dehydrogenase